MARSMRLYKGYSFKEKDPIIDVVRTAVEDEGGSVAELSRTSGVSSATMYNWFNGTTRRPQFATVAAVAISCGKHAIIFGKNGPRLVGFAVPKEHRAFTGEERKKRRKVA